MDTGFVGDLVLMMLSYMYIILVIFVADMAGKTLNLSKKTARKILHILTGNLVLALPFYSHPVFPLMVASPFILITLLASPHSPLENVRKKLSLLSDKTEIGHPLGLVFYSFSFTILTALFFNRPQIVAAGVMPMAYGDGAAALIGEHYKKLKYKVIADKSVVGSLALLTFGFVSLALSLFFYSFFPSPEQFDIIRLSLSVSLLATLVEALSPRGADNLFVPISCATLAYFLVK